MSVSAYTGLPGSGKSYGVVANQVLPALKAGRTVVTNIPLHLEKIEALIPSARDFVVEFPTQKVQADPALIDEYAKPGVVLILDEVWRIWPAGEKANKVPEPFRKLLAEHRHMVNAKGESMQIVLVTQDLAQIGKFARDMIETKYEHTKLAHVGASGSFRVDIYTGKGAKQSSSPEQSRTRQIYGRYDPAIYSLYKSHTMSEAASAGADESSVDGRNNIWRRPMIYVGLAFCVAALAWGIPTVRKSFHPEESMPALRQAKTTLQGAQPANASAASYQRPAAAPSQSGFRVLGMIQKASGGGRVAITDGRATVFIDLDRNCIVDLDLGPVCQWEGSEISMYSEQRYEAPAPMVPIGPATASAGGERSDPPADPSPQRETLLERDPS